MLRKIYDRLQEHIRIVKEYLGDSKEGLLGVFLYGSQNYELATSESDVDTKAIYIPSYEELVFNKPISVELKVGDTNEHCELKDIREMVNMWKKQNTNFVEILFTDYYYINEKYEENFLREFLIYNEKIAHYNPELAIKSMAGQALSTLKRGEQNGGKTYCNLERLYSFFKNYIANLRYKRCLVPPAPLKEKCLKLKMGLITEEEERIEYLTEFFKSIIEGKIEASENKEPFDFKPGVLKLLKDREM